MGPAGLAEVKRSLRGLVYVKNRKKTDFSAEGRKAQDRRREN